MIIYTCVATKWGQYKKGDQTTTLPEGAGNAFVRSNVPDRTAPASVRIQPTPVPPPIPAPEPEKG